MRRSDGASDAAERPTAPHGGTGSLDPAHLGASRGCLARSAQQRDPLVGRRGDVVRRDVEQLPREVRQGP